MDSFDIKCLIVAVIGLMMIVIGVMRPREYRPNCTSSTLINSIPLNANLVTYTH